MCIGWCSWHAKNLILPSAGDCVCVSNYMSMRQIVFTADDFGLSASVNQAIMTTHEQGVLNAAALMTHQPGTEEAVDMAEATPTLCVGIHFHLTDSQPATCREWPWSTSPTVAGFAIGFSRKARLLVANELLVQWERYRELGVRCDFISFHHHLHLHPFVWREMCRVIGNDYAGWVRMPSVRAFHTSPISKIRALITDWVRRRRATKSGLHLSDTLWGADRTFSMDAGEVRAALSTLPSEGIHEFIFHPRHGDDGDSRCLLALKSKMSDADVKRHAK